ADEESLRRALGAPPLHVVHTGAFLIARNELTFGEWLEGLSRLGPAELARLTPGATSESGSISIRRSRLGSWSMIFDNGSVPPYRSGSDGLIRYRGRTRNSEQRWKRFPVLAVSPDEVVEYAKLTKSNLRLCSEHEWERAARGADGRAYAGGDLPPSPLAANFDLSYGRITEAYGPDEVGLGEAAESPFGLNDAQANALEIVLSSRPDGQFVEKGGAWYLDAN